MFDLKPISRKWFASGGKGLFSATLVVVIGLFGWGVEAEVSDGLPQEDCLIQLRQARIAHMNEDTAGELAILRGALESFPGEMAAVAALLNFHHRQPLPPAEHALLIEALTKRLIDSTKTLPLGVLEQIASDPDTSEQLPQLVIEQLGVRATKQSTPEPELLQIRSVFFLKVGQKEAALEDLLAQWRLEKDDSLVWPLVRLASQLDRWPLVVELLEVKSDGALGLLRDRYLFALAKGAPYEKLVREIEKSVAQIHRTDELSAPMEVAEHSTRGVGWLSRALLGVAWALHDRGMNVEAETEFRRLQSLYPDHEEANSVILHMYASEEDRAHLAAAEKATWDSKEEPQELFDEGTQRLTTGDAEGAFELLARAAPHFPDLEAAWYNLGMAAYRLEKWETVITSLERAASLNEQRGDSFHFGGIAASKLGRCEEAIDLLKQGLELDSTRNQAHYYLSDCYRQLGQAEAAAQHLETYRSGS